MGNGWMKVEFIFSHPSTPFAFLLKRIQWKRTQKNISEPISHFNNNTFSESNKKNTIKASMNQCCIFEIQRKNTKHRPNRYPKTNTVFYKQCGYLKNNFIGPPNINVEPFPISPFAFYFLSFRPSS